MKIIELSSATVEIIDKITWGMQEEIRTAMLGGVSVSSLDGAKGSDLQFNPAVLATAKYKTLELCVKKITDKNGVETHYTKEWMDNLAVEDGDKLFEAVNEITSVKKK